MISFKKISNKVKLFFHNHKLEYSNDVTVVVEGTGEKKPGVIMKCKYCPHKELWVEIKTWAKVQNVVDSDYMFESKDQVNKQKEIYPDETSGMVQTPQPNN